MGDDVADGDLAAVERRHAGSRRQQLGDRIVKGDFAAFDELGQQDTGHRLAVRADLERRVLVIRSLGLRADIGAGGRALVDHRRCDAGAGAIVLEAPFECSTQLVVAHGKARH